MTGGFRAQWSGRGSTRRVRPNNSRKDDIVQRKLKLIVWLLNDGQGPVAEIARKRGIPRNRPYKWQKEIALHSGALPGLVGKPNRLPNWSPASAKHMMRGRVSGKIPSGFPLANRKAIRK